MRSNNLGEPTLDGSDMGMSRGMKAWFVFVGLIALASILGTAAMVYLLLDHFGVLVMGGLL